MTSISTVRHVSAAAVLSLLTPVLLMCAPHAAVAANDSDGGMYCSNTAVTTHRACQFEATDDYWKSAAICMNLAEAEDRRECYESATESRTEGLQSCREQLDARRGICGSVGERRYDPEFDELQHETNFQNPTTTNAFLPLRVGNKWELRGGGEVIKVEVLNATKLIDDVRCVVLRDVVTVNGALREATDDWLAQARNGDVWYCGEEVKDYETFPDDQPRNPELVSRDGSFKAGRDGDKPGILFLGNPQVGKVYREEFSIGNAEDVSQVLSTTYSYGSNAELDQLVPKTLAQLLCAARNCVVLKAFTAIEPGVFERKYYAPGIGIFASTKPLSGEVVQLTACNTDPRCLSLPAP